MRGWAREVGITDHRDLYMLSVNIRRAKARVLTYVGRAWARRARARLKLGRDGDGSMPRPAKMFRSPAWPPMPAHLRVKRGKRGRPKKVHPPLPFKHTGHMIKQLRYNRKRNWVEVRPVVYANADKKGKKASHARSVFGINLDRGLWKDPLATKSQAEADQAVVDVRDALQIQIERNIAIFKKKDEALRYR